MCERKEVPLLCYRNREENGERMAKLSTERNDHDDDAMVCARLGSGSGASFPLAFD